MRRLIVLCAVAALAGCAVSPERAQSALEAQGLKNIHVGGWAMFGCDENDNFTATFTATNPSGQPVKGVVCAGWFKGATVRITG